MDRKKSALICALVLIMSAIGLHIKSDNNNTSGMLVHDPILTTEETVQHQTSMVRKILETKINLGMKNALNPSLTSGMPNWLH